MARLTLPRTDNALLAFARHFSSGISASPETYGLTEEQCDEFAAAVEAFAAAMTLCAPNIRNKVSVITKNTACAELKAMAGRLIALINGQASVTDAQKIDLGIVVRRAPTPGPAPSNPPTLFVESVRHRTVSGALRQGGTDTGLRGRPKGMSGAVLFSYVGDAPPTNVGDWKFEKLLAATSFDLTFPATLAAGTKVWLAAAWFNHRKELGPACAPVITNLQGGGAEIGSMRIAA